MVLPSALPPSRRHSRAVPSSPAVTIALLSGSIRRLAAYEPEMVMFLTGAPGDLDEGEARALVVEGIRELGRVAREEGVRIGVEPIHRTANAEFSMITDLPGAEALLAEAGDDSVRILFDTWHLWDTPDVLEHARRLAPRFPAVHVNDWRAETRDWDDRTLPGEGIMDLPAIVGEKYRPPGHSVAVKYWYRRNSGERYRTTEVPLAAKPNLWVSADIDVTPGRRKSKGGTGYPSRAAQGSTNPPRQASVWNPEP